jgi:hypothetical protein
MKYQPALKLWASPWSPPVWMKTNKHYANKRGDHNDLKPENEVLSGDQFIQDEKYLSAYACISFEICKGISKRRHQCLRRAFSKRTVHAQPMAQLFMDTIGNA